MKVVGLITEYNPFHNGHQYHIDEAKRITGADYVIVVMSGNFVQRGTPAFIDKYSRTQMALCCGADIVFELPVCYATSSAEHFALGAVSILHKLGIIDDICFGSECGDTKILTTIANILIEEPAEYRKILSSLMKTGKAFPVARMEAIKAIAPSIDESILSSPNNILGIEYIKALLRLKSDINPVTISRITSDYHQEELDDSMGTAISSATSIRKTLREKTSQVENSQGDFPHEKTSRTETPPAETPPAETPLTTLEPHLPDTVVKILQDNYNKTFPIYEDDCSLLLKYKLMLESHQSLLNYTDMSVDLAHKIGGINTSGLSFSQLALEIKSRQWTLTRVNRVLTNVLLNLHGQDYKAYNASGYAQYARILGIKKASSHLLRIITKNEKIPVITKMADADKLLTSTGIKMLSEDIFASHLYNQLIYNKFHTILKDEYTHGIILY